MALKRIVAALFLIVLCAAAAVWLVGCEPNATDSGVTLPNAATSVGRARLLNELTGDEAKRGQQIAHGAMKDRWGRVIDYNDRQDKELGHADTQLTTAQRERASLIQQVTNATTERIKLGDEWQRKFDADHAKNKWLGWQTRHLIWVGVAIWAGLGIASVVLGIMGMAGPSAFIMRLLPLSNLFALVRDRWMVARGQSIVVPVVATAPVPPPGTGAT